MWHERGSGRRRRGLLVFGMYDIHGLDSAPKVRISLLSAALARHREVELITGGRLERARAAFRWLVRGGPRRVDAVYVESSTSTAMPTDLAFFILMRLFGRPVGIYFRDAYQLFRGIYPLSRRHQLLADWIWRVTMPMMRRLATHRFVQSEGLGVVLGLRDPILLPPGSDPALPDLGAARNRVVAYVGNFGWADGFDTLVEAMGIVRAAVPDAHLRVVGPALAADRAATLPPWVEVLRAGRPELPFLLRDARACVIPRPITPYTNMVLPMKLWDYLSFGKPIVTTATAATAAIVEASGAGLVTDDTPAGLAEGLSKVLEDEALAKSLAARGRAYACSPDATWDARALTVLQALRLS